MAYFSVMGAFGYPLFVEFVPAAKPTHSVEKKGCRYVYSNERLIGLIIENYPSSLNLKPGVLNTLSQELKTFLATLEWPAGDEYLPVINGGYTVVQIEKSEVVEGTHLHHCTVTDGNRHLSLICGAANAQVGLVTVLAEVNTRVANGSLILPTVIQGIPSAEMLCSWKDIGVTLPHGKPGIIDLSSNQWSLGSKVTPEELENAYAKRIER